MARSRAPDIFAEAARWNIKTVPALLVKNGDAWKEGGPVGAADGRYREQSESDGRHERPNDERQARAEAATIERPSSTDDEIGFSTRRWTPALMQSSAIG